VISGILGRGSRSLISLNPIGSVLSKCGAPLRWGKSVPLEDVFLLTLVIVAFVIFALALAYGSAVASGTRKSPKVVKDSAKS